MDKTTIEFSSDAAVALDGLASTLKTTKADVIHSALSLYNHVVTQLHKSSKYLAIVSAEGGVKVEIAVPGLDVAHTRRETP